MPEFLEWVDWNTVLWECYQVSRKAYGRDFPDWDEFTFELNSRMVRYCGYAQWNRDPNNRDYTVKISMPFFEAVCRLAGREACVAAIKRTIMHEFAHLYCNMRGWKTGHNKFFKYAMYLVGLEGSRFIQHTIDENLGWTLPGTSVAIGEINELARKLV